MCAVVSAVVAALALGRSARTHLRTMPMRMTMTMTMDISIRMGMRTARTPAPVATCTRGLPSTRPAPAAGAAAASAAAAATGPAPTTAVTGRRSRCWTAVDPDSIAASRLMLLRIVGQSRRTCHKAPFHERICRSRFKPSAICDGPALAASRKTYSSRRSSDSVIISDDCGSNGGKARASSSTSVVNSSAAAAFSASAAAGRDSSSCTTSRGSSSRRVGNSSTSSSSSSSSRACSARSRWQQRSSVEAMRMMAIPVPYSLGSAPSVISRPSVWRPTTPSAAPSVAPSSAPVAAPPSAPSAATSTPRSTHPKRMVVAAPNLLPSLPSFLSPSPLSAEVSLPSLRFASVSRQRAGKSKTRATSQAASTSADRTAESEAPSSLSAAVAKGVLVEFEKERGKMVVGVVTDSHGRKNWMVVDQFGTSFSVKPQQIKFVAAEFVPRSGEEDGGVGTARSPSRPFTPADIVAFRSMVDSIRDDSLLQLAWEEMSVSATTAGGGFTAQAVRTAQVAELLYGSTGPVQCYAAHSMLTSDAVYFKQRKGCPDVFEPRPPTQVEQLQQQAAAAEAARQRKEAFAARCREASRAAWGSKPRPEDWHVDEFSGECVEALKCYSLGRAGGNLKLAAEILEQLSLPRTAAAGLDLLLSMGVLPRHYGAKLITADLPLAFPDKVTAAAEAALACPPTDLDKDIRRDLTHLKVYMVDSSDTVEVDDGLSAEELADGRVRIWIHVADPTRWMSLGDVMDREALSRATSVYLPTGVVPMLPLCLAAGPMSLQQQPALPDGRCCAVSVGVVLRDDGSVQEYEVMPSYICPTYRLTYEQVPELLREAAEEEREMVLLAQAAEKRRQWRADQGSVELHMPEPIVKVYGADEPEPTISVAVVSQADPERRLVAEMMVLCGELVADFGATHSLALPYRGQQLADLSEEAMEGLRKAGVAPGPCMSVHLRRFMRRSTTSCVAPVPHAALGLPGYVQFSSPIRRYGDLLAHYQVKAVLRGEQPPMKAAEMERLMVRVSNRQREAKQTEDAAQRYWLLAHLQRLPQGTVLSAMMLRWLKDDPAAESLALVLLSEVGYETPMLLSRDVKLGQQVNVVLGEVNPRADVLRLYEAPPTLQGRRYFDT